MRFFLDHFDLVSPFYDRLFSLPDPGWLRELLRLPGAGRVLDLGGGTGRVARALQGSADEIVVLDESVGMLRQAQKKGLPAVNGEAERLPFANGAFARILMVDTFHHLRDQRRAVAELLRVLAPGGRLVVEEPNVEQLSARLVAFAERLALMRSHFRSPREAERLFEGAGASVRLERKGATFWAVVDSTADTGLFEPQ
jgi:ubiquinone/menaquinone biosynthesis C-methylase UbiE